MKFYCNYNISEYTKLLNIFNFLIEMFMHVYISLSKQCAITMSYFIEYKPLKKNGKVKGYKYIYSKRTLFFKK